MQDRLRQAIKDGTVPIPPELLGWKALILERLRNLAGKLDIKNADDKKLIPHRREVYLSPDFKALWDRIKHRTQLTRRSWVDVLQRSGRLDDFKVNPQQFIDLAAQDINRYKQHAVVDGIRCTQLDEVAGEEPVWAQELFEATELLGYLNTLQTSKSVYESVLYDSDVERSFADALEKNEAVKLYVKLPGWFKIPTPLGSYNPDWAVVINSEGDHEGDHEGEDKLYFGVETKGSIMALDLRTGESDKIDCGGKHFEALCAGENPARFGKAKTLGAWAAERTCAANWPQRFIFRRFLDQYPDIGTAKSPKTVLAGANFRWHALYRPGS